jgi:hypothetical protein
MTGLTRRCQPMPSAAWCTDPGCRWQDPVSVLGITLDEHDVAVEKLAEAHAVAEGHETWVVRTQAVIFRSQPAEVTA